MKKIVAFAFGCILLAGTLTIGLRYFFIGKNFSLAVEEQQIALLQEKEEYFMTRYEGLTPSGKDVIKYIKQNIDRIDSIIVVTDTKTFAADTSQFASYQVSTSDYYINPLKTYEITLNRNKNGVISEATIRVKE